MNYEITLTAIPNLTVKKVIYRELTTDDDFEQCINLQRNVFKLPDSHIISPLLLKLFSRQYPPTGLSVGAFIIKNDKPELIGIIIGMATELVNSNYILLLGIKKEYENKIYGYRLMEKYKEISLSRNINQTYGVFNPLEPNLARLYFKVGFKGIKYIKEKQDLNSISTDKLLIKWNFNNSNFNKENKNINTIPVVMPEFMPDEPKVLVELPSDYKALKTNYPEKIEEWRKNYCKILNNYINDKKYQVSDCITKITNNKRNYYYLLENHDISPTDL